MSALNFVFGLLSDLVSLLRSFYPFGGVISIFDIFIGLLIISTLIVVFIPTIKNDVKY